MGSGASDVAGPLLPSHARPQPNSIQSTSSMSHDEDADSDEVDLQSSELGTHAYWQQAYTRELDALEELGDEGEIWYRTAQSRASADSGILFASLGWLA